MTMMRRTGGVCDRDAEPAAFWIELLRLLLTGTVYHTGTYFNDQSLRRSQFKADRELSR